MMTAIQKVVMVFSKRFILGNIVFWGVNLAEAAPPPNNLSILTLDTVFQLAEKNTPGLQARLKKIQAMQKALQALPKWYLPNLSVQGGYSLATNGNESQHGPLARVVGDWILWDGDRTSSANVYQQAIIKSEQAEQVAALFDCKIKVASVYYGAILNVKRLEIAQAQIAEYRRFIGTVRQRARLGRVGSSDVRRLELLIKKQELELETHGTALQQAHLRLESYLGLESGLFSLPDFDDLPAPQEADPKGFANFEKLPWVRHRQARIKALAAKIKAKERELYWPRIGAQIYGGYGPHIDAIDSTKPEVGAAVTVTVPLYSRADRGAQVESVRLQIEAERSQLEQELRDARLDYQKLFSDYRLALKKQSALQTIRTELQKNFKVAYVEYARGLVSYSDVKSNIDGYFRTYNESILSEYEFRLLGIKLKLLSEGL